MRGISENISQGNDILPNHWSICITSTTTVQKCNDILNNLEHTYMYAHVGPYCSFRKCILENPKGPKTLLQRVDKYIKNKILVIKYIEAYRYSVVL